MSSRIERYESGKIQPPRLKLSLVESEEEESSDVEIIKPRMQAVAENVADVNYSPRRLTDAEANVIVAVLWQVQLLHDKSSKPFLCVGDEIEYPSNQQGIVTRKIYATVPVAANLSSLAVSPRFSYENYLEFGVKCQFIVGEQTREMQGLRVNNARVPFPFQRRHAKEIQWATFNPLVHSETLDDNRTTVVFIDKPNVPLHGDSFFLSTSVAGSVLNQVGTSPNSYDLDDEEKQRNESMLHFYDDTYVPNVCKFTATNMHGQDERNVASDGTSVNIVFTNAPFMELQKWYRAKKQVQEFLTTLKRIDAVVKSAIVNGEKFI